MLITITGIILTIGSWELQSEAVAKNFTIGYTIDNRVKINSVIYTDGKECIIASNVRGYTFYTENDAIQWWNRQRPPFASVRYEELLHIISNDCYAFQGYLAPFIEFSLLVPIVFLLIDCIVMDKVARCCGRLADRIDRVHNINESPQASSKKEPEPKLSAYAAELIAEAHINRGDRCPVTLEPFNRGFVLVPDCGHVISEAAAAKQIPKQCCVCRKDVIYRRVEAKLNLIKEGAAATNQTNTDDSTTELIV